MPLAFTTRNYTCVSLLLFAWAVSTSWDEAWTLLASGSNSDGSSSISHHGNLMFNLVAVIMLSELKSLVLMNMICNVFVLAFEIVVFLSLGVLRSLERSNLSEHFLNFLLFKIVFVGAVLEPDIYEICVWGSYFSMTGFLKLLGFVCKERAEYQAVIPGVSPRDRAKLAALLSCVLSIDVCLGYGVLVVFAETDESTKLLLLFEPLVIALRTMLTLVKHAVCAASVAASEEAEHTDDGDEVNACPSLYYVDFAVNLIVGMLSILHYFQIWVLNGVSFTIIDGILFLNMRIMFLRLSKQVGGFINYHRILSSMRTFPDVTDWSEIQDVCAICLRNMTASVKKLPCGHYFHVHCLHRWLERLETNPVCPVCRSPLLTAPAPPTSPPLVATPRGASNEAVHARGSNGIDDLLPAASEGSTLSTFVDFQLSHSPTNPGWTREARHWPSALPLSPLSRVAAAIRYKEREDIITRLRQVDVRAQEKQLLVAGPFLPSMEERHAAFQNRKERLKAAALRLYRQRHCAVEGGCL
jgi:hypothetical protein